MRLARALHLSVAPVGATPLEKKNFLNVQVDALGVGLVSAASTFLPVFLTRLGATNFQVGLLTAMPAFAGLFLTLAMGRFLQGRRNVVPWFSGGSLIYFSSYGLIGLISFVVPEQHRVLALLLVWAVAIVPQTLRSVGFSVVMNAVAGPRRRYELMSRRWSILGLTSAVTVAVVGQLLARLRFPINYQLIFIALSAGGFVSFYYSRRIKLPDAEPQPRTVGLSPGQRLKGYLDLIRGQPAFVSFTAKRLVYIAGSALAAPLFPLYYVRQVEATDAWIGIINTSQTAITLLGYFLWLRQGRARGSRFVLLRTTFALAFYPALVASTRRVELIALFAGLAGIFQAGLDLVFFDELMKTVPSQHSAIFVSVAQTLQHFLAVMMPLLGTLLADRLGIGGTLAVSAALRLLGCGLFAWGKEVRGKDYCFS
jgi:MFS family permease